jgi:hypothetical protein
MHKHRNARKQQFTARSGNVCKFAIIENAVDDEIRIGVDVEWVVTGTSFTPLTAFSSPCNYLVPVPGFSCWQAAVTVDAVPAVGKNISGHTLNFGVGSTIVLPTNALLVHPGESSDTIVRWTAPTAGTYSILGVL